MMSQGETMKMVTSLDQLRILGDTEVVFLLLIPFAIISLLMVLYHGSGGSDLSGGGTTDRSSTSRVKIHQSGYFWFQPTAKNVQMVNDLRSIGEYKPPWWYWSHLGAIFAFGHDPQLRYEREIITHADGSRCAIDWYPRKPTPLSISLLANGDGVEPIKICVFIPGLGLSSRSKFCQKFVQTCDSQGVICAVVNHRGVELPLETEKFWHPAHTEDVTSVLKDIQNILDCKDPLLAPTCCCDCSPSSSCRLEGSTSRSAKVFMVGYSAGTNVMMKTILKNQQFKQMITAMLCVCVTYDYKKSRDNLENTLIGSIYSWLITLNHKQTLRRNQHVLSRSKSDDMLTRISSKRMYKLSHFDAYASTELFGYSKESDYHNDLSNFQINEIDVPTLMIQPQDDPLHYKFMHQNIRPEYFCCNDNFIFYHPPFGNHFGFYEGSLNEAFTNTTSYTFPAKLGLAFFHKIISDKMSTHNEHHSEGYGCRSRSFPDCTYYNLSTLYNRHSSKYDNDLIKSNGDCNDSVFFTCCLGNEQIE